ncbi:hypothetical protein VWX34_02205 [Phaeobacter sp. A40a-4a]|uniref:hypothetical protein n=1 Tax=unclassified Phaeobacter TaxID=2621772 RepID=UPI003A86C0A2
MQVLAELGDPILIHLRHVRVQQWRLLIGIVQELAQLRLPRLQLLGFVFKLCWREALKNGIDHLVELSVNLLEFAPPAGQVGSALDPEPIYLSHELGTEFIEEFRRHEMLPKAI